MWSSFNYKESIRNDKLFNILFTLWVIQNIILGISVILAIVNLSSEGNLAEKLFFFSLYFDSVLFIAWGGWGILVTIRRKNYWGILVTIGAWVFLLLSTSYRALIEFYPDFGQTQIVVDLLDIQKPNLDPNQELGTILDELSKILNLFLYTNVALLLFSIGISRFFERTKLKKFILVFGFLNVFLASNGFFLIFKPVISAFLLGPLHFHIYRDKYR